MGGGGQEVFLGEVFPQVTRASKSISREGLGWMEVENSQPVVETPAGLPVSQRRFWASMMQRAAEKGHKEDAFIARET